MKERIEKALNEQVRREADSSRLYLAMAVWAEVKGMGGIAEFLYTHSEEERVHMLKLIKFINERGGTAQVTALEEPKTSFESIEDIFSILLEHEIQVTEAINELVDICLEEKDFTTHNFMQWYVSEQLEEEALARTIMDKLKMIGSDKGGLYLFDRDIQNISVSRGPNK